MQKLSLSIAEKLLMLRNGERIPAGLLRQAIFTDLLSEQILYKIGKSRGHIVLQDKRLLDLYLQNHFAVNDLDLYVNLLQQRNLSKATQIKISTDSKLTVQRSFKGFLVNCYEPISVKINNSKTVLHPLPGLFHFVYDFENFIPDEGVTIVGVENPESFRYVEKQKNWFSTIKPLFISRYPQNQHADIIRWLRSIPNFYLHFGDFDLAGINIYLNEIKKHIPDKSSFFIPANMEYLLETYGNTERYDKQKLHVDMSRVHEVGLTELITLIHRQKKGLDQEILQDLPFPLV